jgi:hypothetical protein
MHLVIPQLRHVNRNALNAERQRKINKYEKNAREYLWSGPRNHSWPKRPVSTRRNRRTRSNRRSRK